MAIETSRTAQPVTDTPRGGAMGAWGIWLSVIVLTMFVAGLATAALYLETTQPAWPPEDIEVPARGWALLALAAIGIAAGATTRALWRLRRGAERLPAVGLAVAGGALTGALIALIADLGASGFRWDEHSYTSVYWSLTGFTLTFVAVGLLMVAAVLVQTLTGLVDARRHLELSNLVVYLWFTFATSVLLLGLVHLLPAVGAPR